MDNWWRRWGRDIRYALSYCNFGIAELPLCYEFANETAAFKWINMFLKSIVEIRLITWIDRDMQVILDNLVQYLVGGTIWDYFSRIYERYFGNITWSLLL